MTCNQLILAILPGGTGKSQGSADHFG